jgi:hypothetical protein
VAAQGEIRTLGTSSCCGSKTINTVKNGEGATAAGLQCQNQGSLVGWLERYPQAGLYVVNPSAASPQFLQANGGDGLYNTEVLYGYGENILTARTTAFNTPFFDFLVGIATEPEYLTSMTT